VKLINTKIQPKIKAEKIFRYNLKIADSKKLAYENCIIFINQLLFMSKVGSKDYKYLLKVKENIINQNKDE